MTRISSCLMEVQQLCEIQFCQKLAIVLIAFASIASSVHCLSSLTEVTESKLHSSKNSTTRDIYASEKFILKSYFDKYKFLDDATFSHFVECELPSTMCEMLNNNWNALVRLSVLGRSLIGEGSHRHLFSSIGLFINSEIESQMPVHVCELIIIERLPLGVFADPFELQRLHDMAVFTNAAVFGDTNLELPSFHSNRSAVEIQMMVGPDVLLRKSTVLEFNIQLPLHARYPQLDESGYSTMKFTGPDLFMRCTIEGIPQNQTCLALSPNDISKSKNESGSMIWKVPSGIRAHAGVVSAITFTSALLATFLIVLTSVSSPSIKLKKL